MTEMQWRVMLQRLKEEGEKDKNGNWEHRPTRWRRIDRTIKRYNN